MARKFNGTTDKITTATLTMSAASVVSYAFWAWDDVSLPQTDSLLIYGSHQCYHRHGRSGSAGVSEVGMFDGTHFWADSYPQPSPMTWHHYCCSSNRATPLNTAYVDGVLQSLTTIVHQAVTPTTYSDATAFMFTDGAANFAAGRIADVAIWAGVTLNGTEAGSLAAGASPLLVHPTGIVGYWPIVGASPEPDYSGNAFNGTVTGTTVVNNPGVSPLPISRAGFPKQLLAA